MLQIKFIKKNNFFNSLAAEVVVLEADVVVLPVNQSNKLIKTNFTHILYNILYDHPEWCP